MWLFLSDGFFSIVAPTPRDPAMMALPANMRTDMATKSLLVRARHVGDIERVFGDVVVHQSPNRDYRYRALIARDHVSTVIARELAAVTYPNFKNSIPDREYHDACSRVWGVMDNYQTRHGQRDSDPLKLKGAPAASRFVKRS